MEMEMEIEMEIEMEKDWFFCDLHECVQSRISRKTHKLHLIVRICHMSMDRESQLLTSHSENKCCHHR
jgi:hypothetical protein